MKPLITLLSILITNLSLSADTYVLKLADLDFEEKSKSLTSKLNKDLFYSRWTIANNTIAPIRSPKGTRVYLAPKLELFTGSDRNRKVKIGDHLVAIETSNDQPFSSYIDIQDGYHHSAKISTFKFNFDPSKHQKAKQNQFEQTKKLHFHLLSKTDSLGKPWFHHQASGLKIKETDNRNDRFNRSEFSLYTGARAISDNLALDRQLRLMGEDTDAKIDVNTIDGIKVAEIDWKPLLPTENVAIDPLAMLIPEDQHVLISPSLKDINKIVALLEKEGSPLAQSFTVRNPFRTLPQRYKEQLGIDFPPALANLLPIKSVAVTGYDPFFPTGTDIAILLESTKAHALYNTLDKAIKTPDKNIAVLGNIVIISNSKKQLDRIKSVHSGKTTSLGSLDEYKFFRHRYPTADKTTGFVFLSDACIRRWGGPHLRIAASRRTKSIAALNHLTAHQIALTEQGALLIDNDTQSDAYQFLLGKVTNKNGLIQSEKMGNLQWLKPTIDMDLSKVTKKEAEAYAQWRRGYEEGWAKVFDPIGFSFTLNDKTKELDLTVMPLSISNDYQDLISLAGKSILSSEARLASDANIMTASIALDKDGKMLADFNRSMISMMPSLKIKPLAWLGQSITFFAEKDPHWAKLASDEFDEIELLLGAPLGLRIEHSSKLKLAMFLTALKTTIESAAPDTVKWETKSHHQDKYVVLTSNELGLEKELTICYAITKSAIIFTMNEEVLKRAINRETAEPKLNLIQTTADHLYLNADSRFLIGLNSTGGPTITQLRRKQSYRAIPILNEWHRLWSNKNPISEHLHHFGEDIHCPGGKGYQWNAKDMTMESTTYGHPANQKEIIDNESLLDPFGHIESAMKFEHDGLRIKLKLTQKKTMEAPPKNPK